MNEHIIKELDSISLPITEVEYRQMPELSYSTLATYERTGFNGLDHLFDRKESPALTFGSCVDAMITGGEDEFNSLFLVSDIPALGDKEKQVADYLFSVYGTRHAEVESIPATYILEALNTCEFQKNWRDDTRVRVISERISDYYKLKGAAQDKTIISRPVYDDACACVRALRTSVTTCQFFADNIEETPIRRYYQLKFKAEFNGVGYRNMADLIIVNYEKKIITPVDLKTSSHAEWDFEESFMQWQYAIQARLYWRIIKDNLMRDDYFRDFTLSDYHFIVVNRKTLTPLVWNFPYTQRQGTLVDKDGREFRDPFEIGEELRKYLDHRPRVPKNISQNKINTIKCLRPANSVKRLPIFTLWD